MLGVELMAVPALRPRSTPSLGNHCAMKKKLPMAPVRAKVRGTCAVHLTSMVALPPGGDRLRQRHRHHRLVVRVAVVGRDEALRRREVSGAPRRRAPDVAAA